MGHITLRQQLTRELKIEPDLVFLIEDIATACRIVAQRVRNGPFEGTTGAVEATNVQGEIQKGLDVIANEIFLNHCTESSRVAALISEEEEKTRWLKEPEPGDFVVCFDPLDGSSNLDVNLSVGSIFSVYRVIAGMTRNSLIGSLSGRSQICAGYSVYGPSTSLVITTGHQVDGYTFQLGSGEFRLTHPDLNIPPDAYEIAINASRQRHWAPEISDYVGSSFGVGAHKHKASHNMRWTGSMVADVHRILMRGGVFLYPTDNENKVQGGRLRLLYEACPMAFVVETAGGRATDGTVDILDIQFSDRHQRTGVALGAAREIERILSMRKDA